ncbi:DUF4157 domain-containing protein [Streptomyces sp. NPDC006134]|uniref:eCIS core domain-containing protein n=1 Tax=Streptomyces sp. NPDC006134 TaxID=3154467 RepID=UPI0033C056AA
MTEYVKEPEPARAAGGTTGAGRQPSLGRGRPLDPFLRADMETRLGADLSEVRLHTSSDAGRAARAPGARAVTVGRHVMFADGEYRPSDAAGRRLITHELTHTVQQMRGGREPPGSRPRSGPRTALTGRSVRRSRPLVRPGSRGSRPGPYCP